ncbi:MAG: hypothetical protein ACKVP7_05960 [Hyphomicrobiaceae bacterium]
MSAPTDTSGSPTQPTTSATPPQPKLSPEDAAKIGELQKRLAATFGEIVAVLMRSAQHKHLFLTDLEWLILPSLKWGQPPFTQQSRMG